jgi:hypothetical protein
MMKNAICSLGVIASVAKQSSYAPAGALEMQVIASNKRGLHFFGALARCWIASSLCSSQ